MIPRTYPTTYLTANGKQQMMVYFLGSVEGLERWSDYIPVKASSAVTVKENSYDNDGVILVKDIGSTFGKQAWKDYIPVYVDPLATDAWKVDIDGFIPTFPTPSLSLDFTSSSETLDPRITFSRTTNATRVNSQGLIEYAPHNLLTFSEQFNNAAWSVSGGSVTTVTANTTIAPNGTKTADRIAFTGTGPSDRIFQDSAVNAVNGVPVTGSVWLRADTPCTIRLSVERSGPADVEDVVCSVTTDWQRFTVSHSSTWTGSSSLRLRLHTISVIGSVDAWGAQLNVGALQPYYPTTVKNLLGFSEAFDNAFWTKANSSISGTKVNAPNGTLTGLKLQENPTAVQTYVFFNTSVALANIPYTWSIYAKAAERNWFAINAFDGTNRYTFFNLSNGTVGTNAAGNTASITSVGNGWYRCSVTRTATATASGGVGIALAIADNNITYNGTLNNGIFFWGAQLSDSASVDPYVNNPGAAPTSTAYYGPRFDYDPVTLQPKGLLIEEQRTNACTFSEDLSASVWGTESAVRTSNTATAPNGQQTADSVSFSTNIGKLIRSAGNHIPVGASTTYTISVWLRVTSGTFKLKLSRTNAATWTTAAVSPELTVTTEWQRFSLTYTTGAADTLSDIVIGAENKTPYTLPATGTVLVWGVQHELGAFATSYIPTVAAQVTRAADVATITGSNFSGFYNQNEGTLFADVALLSASYTGGVALDVGAGGAFGTTEYLAWNGTQWGLFPNTAPINVTSLVTTTNTAKVAGGLKANDSVLSANGLIGTVDTSCAIPASATIMSLGKAGWSAGNYLNGTIRKIGYYPTRLSNAQLQNITS